MKDMIQTHLTVWRQLAISLALFGCLGCLSYHTEGMVRYDADWQELESGHHAFQEGDFKTAEEIFERLNQESEYEVIERMALYGLACACLALAETPDALNDALRIWDAWSQLTHDPMMDEDPRMLGPLLHNERQACQNFLEFKDRESQERLETREKETQERLEVQEKETQNLLKTKDKDVRRLKRRLRQMRKENQTLRHQIEALESIHQKIQEKRKEYFPPDQSEE